jgi:hypothetical protein
MTQKSKELLKHVYFKSLKKQHIQIKIIPYIFLVKDYNSH